MVGRFAIQSDLIFFTERTVRAFSSANLIIKCKIDYMPSFLIMTCNGIKGKKHVFVIAKS